jgi:hypothetical protein
MMSNGDPPNPSGASSIHGTHTHVLLGLVKDLEMVNSRSPKEFVVFLIKVNALVKLLLVGDNECLLALLLPPPPPKGMVMQVFGECLKLNPS